MPLSDAQNFHKQFGTVSLVIQCAGHGLSSGHLSELNIADPGMQSYSEKDSDYILTYSSDKLQEGKQH